jgi:hypothetical protein
LTVVSFFYQSIGQGYVFNPTRGYSTIWAQALGVLVPLFLFITANWCLTTLFEGEGSFKDIFIACSYSLLPVPMLVVPATILSNMCTNSEIDIIGFISTLSFIWLGLLIFFGTQVTHDYSIFKNVLTCIGTIVAMGLIMFCCLLFSTLMMKMVTFVTGIVVELSYR